MNNSPQRTEYLKKQKQTKIKITVLRIVILVLFFAAWEALTAVGILDPFIVSSPSRCLQTTINLFNEGTLFEHIGVTLLETVLGFVLGTVLGVIIAIALWCSETARRVSEPYLVVLNALPKIALGPVIIVWIGSGMGAIITITLLISLVVTIIGVLNGYMEVDKEKIQLLRSFGASRKQVFTKVVFPEAFLPPCLHLKLM